MQEQMPMTDSMPDARPRGDAAAVPSAEAIRVLLVDDHPSLLWGLEKVIESASPAMRVVGKAISCREALKAAQATVPDIVLLDLDLGTESGIGLIPELKSIGRSRVVVLTGAGDSDAKRQAVLAGAYGFVHKSATAEVILEAIAHVHAGRLWFDSDLVAGLLVAMSDKDGAKAGRSRGAPDELTSAERKVIATVAQHRSSPNKVVAEALHISSHTLRNHLASIYGKLGIRCRLDLVFYAKEHDMELPASASSQGRQELRV
jgi:DNA-binding NarL/FixJ family response regulator